MRDLTINESQLIDGGFGPGGLKGGDSADAALVAAFLSSFIIFPGALAVMVYELGAGAAVGGTLLKAAATTILGVSATAGIAYGFSTN
jgi:hypothetical protein